MLNCGVSLIIITALLGVRILLKTSGIFGDILPYPFKVFSVASGNWNGDSVGNWVVVDRGIVLVNVVNKGGDLVVSGGQLELIATSLGGHSTQLEISPLEIAIVLVGGGNQVSVEQGLDESSRVLVVVDRQVDEDYSRFASRLWSICFLEFFCGQMFWNISRSIFIP